MSADRLEAVCARLEAAVTRLESCGGSGGAGDSGDSSASLDGYDEILNGPFAKFMDLSKTIGSDVAEQAVKVKAGFDACRAFLVIASKHRKPSASKMQELLKPISTAVGDVQTYREQHRPSKLFNHLSAVSEAIGAIGWVAVEPKPAPYCKEATDSGQFYSNRVLKEAKEKGEPTHTEWVRAFIASLTDLQAYIKKYHTTGVVWNSKGPEAPAGSAPAPGPPPAVAPSKAAPAAGKPAGGGPPAGLFAALNKGGNVTSGLKKVSKDQMTHKNPELRASSMVKASDTPKAAAAPKVALGAPVKKAPVFERKGNKWLVEHQDGSQEITIEDTATKQTVYVFKCVNTVIQVKGKVNNITLDGCKKCGVVFDDVIAGLDIINCQSVKAQVNGKTPMVSIDKTDGCQVYLNKDCMDAAIVTAKSSEMNISVPKADGEFTECPLAEQFVSTWNGKSFDCRPSEIAA